MRAHKYTLAAALAVAASLSLTACGGDDDTAQGDTSSASSASSSQSDSGAGSSAPGQEDATEGGGGDSTAGSSGGQDASAGSGSAAGGAVAKCRTDDLDITAQDSTIGGDEENSVAVTLLNGGGKGCALSGFAGVDLKTGAGTVSAKRVGQPADRMVLKSGESVSFGISYQGNDSGGSGVGVTGLVVTPPGETKSFSLEWPGKGTLPVTDGSGSPVKVGPIGSAGQGG